MSTFDKQTLLQLSSTIFQNYSYYRIKKPCTASDESYIIAHCLRYCMFKLLTSQTRHMPDCVRTPKLLHLTRSRFGSSALLFNFSKGIRQLFCYSQRQRVCDLITVITSHQTSVSLHYIAIIILFPCQRPSLSSEKRQQYSIKVFQSHS